MYKIVLKTKCDCRRVLDITFDKPPIYVNYGRYLVAIPPKCTSSWHQPSHIPEVPQYTQREFRYEGSKYMTTEDDIEYFIYEEI